MLPPMKERTWLGIGVGTLIGAIGFWFAILALSTSRVTALAIAGVAIVMASYAMAAYSGAENIADTGFKAALLGLVAGGGMFGFFLVTGNDLFIVTAPIAAVGTSGTYSLAPTGPLLRRVARLTLLVIGGTIVWIVFTVDSTVYGLIVPLIPLPAVGLADRVFDRAVTVIAEDPMGEAEEAGP